MADHSTKSIVIAIRGSLSMRDVFTDLVANAERFDAPGMPPDSSAHRGMVAGVDCMLKRLREGNILERICATYPEYTLVLTGHSLGAGVSILLAAKLRSRFPDLRVYAFATPAGLLSREAARCTESFAFTIGVGDDFVMRLGVDSIENLRTSVIETIRACKLPKVCVCVVRFLFCYFLLIFDFLFCTVAHHAERVRLCAVWGAIARSRNDLARCDGNHEKGRPKSTAVR